MANDNGRLPIAAAKRLAEEHHLEQVVIIARTTSGIQVCTTYGRTQKDCENAAIAGRFWEKVIQLGTKSQAVAAIRKLLKELE